jgi:hypothetical protein
VAEASDRPRHLPRLEPGSVFAGYRIESLLARGGMGVVYKAKDLELERTVALKIIAPEHTQDETAVARFKSEARIAASLEHPNIVPIHRGGEYDGVLYLAMRFVPGTNLREVIDRAPMDLPRVGRILSDIARALDVAHDRGLVHRDVKPANILISGEGDQEQVYLTDFGLTKRLGSHGDLTRPGGWVGTPDYVAPEQIQARDVDGRADIYSLGCVLYEMLTGHVAYPKGSDVAKLWAHVSDPPPLPSTERPELVAGFDEAVAKATAKDPDERFRSAGEFGAAVRAAVAEQEQMAGRRGAAAFDDPRAATRDSGLATHDDVFIGGASPPPGPPPAYAGPPPAAVSPAAAVDPPVGHGGGNAPEDSWFRRRRWPLAGAVALLAAGIAAILLLSSGGSSTGGQDKANADSKPAPAGRRVSGNLGPVPTNRVSGDGKAVLRLNGTVATVSLDTNKLLDSAPHALHIHAGARGECPSRTAAKLHNGNLSIATKSGVPFYGHAVTALTTRGNTDPDRSLLAFGRYPKAGKIRYERKIDVGPVVADYIRKNNAVVVVHGIDYNHNGLYDGTLDRSDLNRSLPGESTAPALCGVLIAEKGKAKSSSSGKDSKGDTKTTGAVRSDRTQVFAAALEPGAGGGSSEPGGGTPPWHCVLPAAPEAGTQRA